MTTPEVIQLQATLERDPEGVTLTKEWLLGWVRYLATQPTLVIDGVTAGQAVMVDTIAAHVEEVVGLREGLTWLATVHHQVQHKNLIAAGQTSFEGCDAKTCKHAVKVLMEGWRQQ